MKTFLITEKSEDQWHPIACEKSWMQIIETRRFERFEVVSGDVHFIHRNWYVKPKSLVKRDRLSPFGVGFDDSQGTRFVRGEQIWEIISDEWLIATRSSTQFPILYFKAKIRLEYMRNMKLCNMKLYATHWSCVTWSCMQCLLGCKSTEEGGGQTESLGISLQLRRE